MATCAASVLRLPSKPALRYDTRSSSLVRSTSNVVPLRGATLTERARGGWRRERPEVRTPPVFPDSGDRFAGGAEDEEEYDDYEDGDSAPRSYRAAQWHDGPGVGCAMHFIPCWLSCTGVSFTPSHAYCLHWDVCTKQHGDTENFGSRGNTRKVFRCCHTCCLL